MCPRAPAVFVNYGWTSVGENACCMQHCKTLYILQVRSDAFAMLRPNKTVPGDFQGISCFEVYGQFSKFVSIGFCNGLRI
jgi:hypothetical protein